MAGAGGQAALSLELLALATACLFGSVCVLFLYVILFKAFHRSQARYRTSRRRYFQAAVEKVFAGADLEELTTALSPILPGDLRIIEDVILEVMRRIKGDYFFRLQRVAFRLGIPWRHLARLHSRRRHLRGRAMYVLGVMRVPHAVVGIIDILEEERLDLKLVALRALAAIGDPAVIPYFLKAADQIPSSMVVRLCSLLLEFGPRGEGAVRELVGRYPERFPPSVLSDIPRRMAAA